MSVRSRGFTVVELLVVMVVIAILVTIASISFVVIQQDQRNDARNANTTIIANALEKYYERNGEYPGCGALTVGNPSTISQNTLKGIRTDALRAPQADSGVENSIRCGDMTPSSSGDFYAYLGDSSQACQTGAACSEWKLKYRKERTNEIIVIDSRRTAAAQGDRTTIAAQALSVSSIRITWPAVGGATSYNIQYTTTTNWSNVTNRTYSSSTTSATITGLNANTTYHFRIQPVTTSGTGSWSDSASARTLPVVAPSSVVTSAAVYNTTNVRGTMTPSTCVNGATIERQIRYKTNNGSWGAWQAYPSSGLVVAATVGSNYTFQAQARCSGGGTTSAWRVGNEASAARPVPAPTGLTISAAMSGTNAVGTAGGGSCSAGTTLQRQIRYAGSNTSAIGTYVAYATGNSRSVAASQGYRYTFQQQARCVGTYTNSNWASSGTANTIRGIATPGATSVSASTSGTNTTYTRSNVTCPSGTTARYQYRYLADWNYDSGWLGPTTSQTLNWSTASQGYNYRAQMRAQCYTVHAQSGYGGAGTGGYIRPVSAPTGIGWSFSKGNNAVYMTPRGTCHSSVSFYGSMVEWVGSSPHTWKSGPNVGKLGWYQDSGYRVNNVYNPTGGVQSSSVNYVSGNQFRARGSFKCKNATTGRESGAVGNTSGIWTW